MNANAHAMNLAPLLDVQGVCKSFRKPDGDELVVLENVNLDAAARRDRRPARTLGFREVDTAAGDRGPRASIGR